MGTSPSTKETTLHHYRDPLTALLADDPEVDFQGVIFQATSDDYLHKRLASSRTAATLAGMRPDGVLVCIDAWGNAHIDFASVIEFAGEQGIPVVGLSFFGVQAALVVSNPYLDALVDLNKTSDGCENCVIGDNTAVGLDAVKALAVLKSRVRKKNPGRVFASGSGCGQERRMRSLQIRVFQVYDVATGESTRLDTGRDALYLNLSAMTGRVLAWGGPNAHLLKLVENFEVSIVRPGEHDFFVNSILDFAPVAAKAEGPLGSGETNLLGGVQTMLTAADTEGIQPINGGAATGRFKDVARLGRPGTPAPDDFIIHVSVLLKKGEAVTREGIMAAHLVCDIAAEEIRAALRGLNRYQATSRRKLIESARPGLLRVALVKMASGVSAMGDTALFPQEPGGFIGASSIMDLTSNLPVFFSPNEYMDGIVRSLS